MDKLDRIGLFGGTFDPIHNAHLQMALCAKKQFNLDQIYFITAKNSPFKTDRVVLDAETRHSLVALAIDQYPDFYASRVELDREGISYTYQTLKLFREEFPQTQIFWILGSDAFAQIHQWENFAYLKDHLHFLVFARERDKDIDFTDIKYSLIDSFASDIASTKIREIIGQYNQNEIIAAAKLNNLVPDIILKKVLKAYLQKKESVVHSI